MRKVTQSGLADAGLEASVFEREAVAPTCFGNLVAIPHPMTPKPLQLLGGLHAAKPIVWENKRVQFVCLLCVERTIQQICRRCTNFGPCFR
ncbi:PTS sugar transporter subunit IIA [Bacillus licheniformis]|nr:PTS sugar transporter subunit IIA [Bacillus licheniformis]